MFRQPPLPGAVGDSLTPRSTDCAADLLAAPEEWTAAFDLVLESNTLQVLPANLRPEAVAHIARFVAPGGTLLVIARGRDASDDPGAMPWPLTKEELAALGRLGLDEIRFEDFFDDEAPPVRRFRVEYHRRGDASDY